MTNKVEDFVKKHRSHEEWPDKEFEKEIAQQRRWREEFSKENEKERKKKIQDILKLAKKHCPVSYEKFVHLLYLELDLKYYQNQKRGVYSKELDSLIAVGKLVLGTHTLKRKLSNSERMVYYP